MLVQHLADRTRVRVTSWIGAIGAVEYADLAGNRWQTKFEVAEGAGGEIVIIAHEPTVISKAPAAEG